MDEVPKPGGCNSRIKLCESSLGFLVNLSLVTSGRVKNGLMLLLNHTNNTKEDEHQFTASPPNVGMRNVFNPNEMYNGMVRGMRYSRLEVKNTLTVVVRHLHPRECYILNLSTNSLKLQCLVLQAYESTQEDILLEQLYVDFVKIQGRTVLEPKLEWPIIHFDTYHE